MRRMMAMAMLMVTLSACLVIAQTTRPAENETVQKDAKFHLWLYWHTSLADDGNTAKTIAMIQRMKKASYTGLALLDGRQHRLDEQTPQYLANVKKVRQACRDAGMDFVATCLPLGYANDIMTVNPNLAEGAPVVNAPWVVKDGKLVSADTTVLLNGTFEENKDNKPASWGIDQPGKVCFVDTEVKYNGKPSIRMQEIAANGEYEHARAWQPIKVKPFQYYHMSVAVKTADYTGQDNRLMALGSTGEHQGRILNIPEFDGVARTQDWKVYHKTFNTFEYDNIALYIGSWAGGKGKIWFADVKLEPAGLSNMVRRDGAPFNATSEDGKTVYVEGRDLPEMKDPLLGKSPYRGGYQWHPGPTITLPRDSSLKEGDKVLLSYYQTAVMYYNDQVPICLADPKGIEACDDIIKSIVSNVQPDYWFLEHDEIRMSGWDKSCRDTGKTPGGVLADNITKLTAMVRKHQPAAKGIFVWSDMFDPHHNAGQKGEYYAVCKGINPWDKSWLGLPKDVGLINWNASKAASVKFFADEGHPQIISGQDGGTVATIIKQAGATKGIEGAIYVTWRGDFGPNVERFAQAVLKAAKEK